MRVVGVNVSCLIREAAIVPRRMSTAMTTNRPVRGSSPSNRLSCSVKTLMVRTRFQGESTVRAQLRKRRQVGAQVQRGPERDLGMENAVECEHLTGLLAAQAVEQRIIDYDSRLGEHGPDKRTESPFETAEMIGKGRAQRLERRAGDAELRKQARGTLLQFTVLRTAMVGGGQHQVFPNLEIADEPAIGGHDGSARGVHQPLNQGLPDRGTPHDGVIDVAAVQFQLDIPGSAASDLERHAVDGVWHRL